MVSIAIPTLTWIDGVGVCVDLDPKDCGAIDVDFIVNGRCFCATRPRHRVIELERFIDEQSVPERAKAYARKQLGFMAMECDLLLESMQDTERIKYGPDFVERYVLSRSGLVCVVFLIVVALSVMLWG